MHGGAVTAAEENLARRLLDALRALEFKAEVVGARRVVSALNREGSYVAARHPDVESQGHPLLVARVDVRGQGLELAYSIPIYEPGIRAAMRKALRR